MEPLENETPAENESVDAESPVAQTPEEVQAVLDQAFAEGLLEEPMSAEGIDSASIVAVGPSRVLRAGVVAGDEGASSEEDEEELPRVGGRAIDGDELEEKTEVKVLDEFDVLVILGKEASNAMGILCGLPACIENGTADSHLAHPSEGWL